MQEQSIQNQNPELCGQPQTRDNWPEKALPRAWIERIFSQMAALYGSRFADMWRGIDEEKIKRFWASELFGFRDQPSRFRQAMHALRSHETPPNLPQFINILRQGYAENPIGLPPPIDKKLAAEKLQHAVSTAYKTPESDCDHLAWAKRPSLTPAAESMLLSCVENKDARFYPIFLKHRRDGRLNSERAANIERRITQQCP